MNLIEADANAALVMLSARELELFRSSLREANEALEDWEFETRMGCTREELRVLIGQIREIETTLTRRAD